MGWVLVAVLIINQESQHMPLGYFTEMESCIEARDVFIATGPKPKINYEAVCIFTDQAKSA